MGVASWFKGYARLGRAGKERKRGSCPLVGEQQRGSWSWEWSEVIGVRR